MKSIGLATVIKTTGAVFALCAAIAANAASPSVSVSQRDGLPTVTMGGGNAMTGQFVFWAEDWKWAQMGTHVEIAAPFKYTISGADKLLNLGLSGRVSKTSDRRLTWDFDIDAATAMPNAIGGGFAFKFDLVNFREQFGEPELLPDNRGWSWGKPDGPRMEMRFDPPLASMFFERNQKNQVRGLIYDKGVPQGRRHYTATLALSGDISIVQTEAERFGAENDASWPANILDWATSPVDLSFLNAGERPAGKRGFLKAEGDKLVFADGTQARFWGTNVAAGSLFKTTHENVPVQARRLSQLGFNLVRLHHMDSDWVQPNVFGKKATDTQTLDEESLQSLDWWIKCLEDEGIYVWLDLHVGRRFKPGDHIDNFDEISKANKKGDVSADLHGYNYVNASMQKAMQHFDEAYLNHLNRFTGKRYKDDPGVVTVLITNENDLTNHYGNLLLPDKKAKQHDAIYMAAANAFAAKTGLSKNKVWQSWEPGPSKIFLNDLEHKFNVSMIDLLRSGGVKAPLVTTSSWGRNPVSSLPALTDGDIIDVHSYGQVGTLETNPVYSPNFVDWIAAAQVVDRPLSVSEWNLDHASIPDRDVVAMYVAGVADLQGWDSMLHFAYSQMPLNNSGKAQDWNAYNDPAFISTLPAAALLYRRHDAKEARTTYVYAPKADQMFSEVASATTSAALRTASLKGKLMIAMPAVSELPWLKPSRIPEDATVITDPQQSLIAANATEATSDTGELTRNWAQGTYKINTPRTQAAMGWIGGQKINLADVDIDVATKSATVAVQSLDNNPISSAGALMISLGARSNPVEEKYKTYFRSEPVVGHLTIRARPGLKLYSRDAASRTERELPAAYADGRYQISLPPDLGSYWLFMRQR